MNVTILTPQFIKDRLLAESELSQKLAKILWHKVFI